MNSNTELRASSLNNTTTSLGSGNDARLDCLIRDALASTGYAPISALDFQVSDGLVILCGEVNSYYLKQVAQESVRRLGVADRIENRVMVKY